MPATSPALVPVIFNILHPIVPENINSREIPVTESTVIASATTPLYMTLPTVTARINSAEKYATENTTLVLFALNVPSHPKTVLTAVPNTTPVTVVPPASLIPTVTCPTSPAITAAPLTTAVRSVPPANPILIAV